MQVRTLDQFNEVLNIQEAAELCGVSHVTFSEWLHCDQTPMGELVEGVHYFRVGRNYKFIKHQLALLFKMRGGDHSAVRLPNPAAKQI